MFSHNLRQRSHGTGRKRPIPRKFRRQAVQEFGLETRGRIFSPYDRKLDRTEHLDRLKFCTAKAWSRGTSAGRGEGS